VKSEDEIDQEIQLEASKMGILLMRNNSGVLENRDGTPVRYGLGNISKDQNKKFKSSDRIAIMPVTITPEMVGQTVGVFLAIEIKREGWKFKGEEREIGQKNFIDFVNARGGRAFFAASVDDFKTNIIK
jgi:hypothetical protein